MSHAHGIYGPHCSLVFIILTSVFAFLDLLASFLNWLITGTHLARARICPTSHEFCLDGPANLATFTFQINSKDDEVAPTDKKEKLYVDNAPDQSGIAIRIVSLFFHSNLRPEHLWECTECKD